MIWKTIKIKSRRNCVWWFMGRTTPTSSPSFAASSIILSCMMPKKRHARDRRRKLDEGRIKRGGGKMLNKPRLHQHHLPRLWVASARWLKKRSPCGISPLLPQVVGKQFFDLSFPSSSRPPSPAPPPFWRAICIHQARWFLDRLRYVFYYICWFCTKTHLLRCLVFSTRNCVAWVFNARNVASVSLSALCNLTFVTPQHCELFYGLSSACACTF